MSIRLGYQIPNFSYPGGPDAIFPAVAAQAREAESSGFDTVLVMDHFYQLPFLGTPDQPMLECYTTLAALSGVTSSIQLSSLVTGNTYRNPALLAKTVSTLDVVSAGRAVLAIGAGWYELEHDQMGYEFGTFTERFKRLDEALQIIEPMLRGQHPKVEGEYYRATDTLNEPRVRDDLPIMIGGSGEKKTFALAARYADHLNIICDPADLPTKLKALAQRCEEAGRDRATLETSYLATVFMGETEADATKVRDAHAHKLGLEPAALGPRQFVGSPDQVAEQLKERVIDVGIDGVIINMVGNGHEPGVVTTAGEALSPLVF